MCFVLRWKIKVRQIGRQACSMFYPFNRDMTTFSLVLDPNYEYLINIFLLMEMLFSKSFDVVRFRFQIQAKFVFPVISEHTQTHLKNQKKLDFDI